MPDEIKKDEEKKCCCVCNFVKSENCQKFLIVAFGTFVGMFCAMSLFFAIHKPPMMHHGHHFKPGEPQMAHPMMHHKDFKKHGKFEKGWWGMPEPNFDEQLPAEEQKPEIQE